MNRSTWLIVYSTLTAIFLLAGLLTGCSSQDTEQKPVIVPVPSTPSGQPSKPSETPQDNLSAETNRVDVVYFYPKVRCGSCISVELRTRDLLEKSFKDAMDSGKLTFQTYVLDDEQNAAVVQKYGALSSQLFITTIKDNTENIRHVEEIWMPKILNDGVAFDEFLSGIMEEALEEVS